MAAPFASAADLIAQCTQVVPFGAAGQLAGSSPTKLMPLPADHVLAVGVALAGGPAVAGAYEFDGAAWSPFAFPLAGLSVSSTSVRPNGDLIAGGYPTPSAPSPVAVRQGGSWSFLGSMSSVSWVGTVLAMPNGDVIAGGWFVSGNRLMVARFDGSSWLPMGAGFDEEVRALVAMPDGSVVAGGWFTQSAADVNHIARFDGTGWQPLGSGFGPSGQCSVESLCVLPNGDLIAGGTFTSAGGAPANRVARWDGSAWRTLGAGVDGGVRSMVVLPDGDLLVVGVFTHAGGVPAAGVARWNGLAWAPVIAGGTDGFVQSVCRLRDDYFVVGGMFTAVAGQASGGAFGLTTACPARVQAAGNGCAGQQLTADRPWTGAPFRSFATGLPNAALVIVVYGDALAPSALASVFSTALPGCMLHVRPDVLQLGFASSGQFQAGFTIPDVPALAGVVLHHQVLSLALDPTLAVGATEALSLTAGAF